MMLKKKRQETSIPSRSRFDSFGRADLVDLLEATMMRSAELFRGLSHGEMDQRWVLSQLEVEAAQQAEVIRALQRKVDLQTL